MVFISLDGLGVTRCRDVCLQLSIMDGDAIYLAGYKIKKKNQNEKVSHHKSRRGYTLIVSPTKAVIFS